MKNKGFKPHYEILNYYGTEYILFFLKNPIKRKVKHTTLNSLLLLSFHKRIKLNTVYLAIKYRNINSFDKMRKRKIKKINKYNFNSIKKN